MPNGKIHRNDLKYVPVDPDPDFDPVHNNKVIRDTIRESNKLRRQKQRDFEAGVKERGWIVGKFRQNYMMGGTNDIRKFLGRREIARLRGEEIMAKLQEQANLIGKDRLIKKIMRRLNA